MDHADNLTGVAEYLYEVGYLKRLPRTGWMIAGVPDPESIAEHSFRTALIAMLLAHLEGADPGKAAILALLHDTQETRIGDVPSVGKPYVQTAENADVTADQTAGFPRQLAAALVRLVTEYEAKETAEARCAKDADKLECLLQAREYQAAGNPQVQPWIDTSVAALRTEAGKRLAEMCLQVEPRDWWRVAAEQYPALPHVVHR